MLRSAPRPRRFPRADVATTAPTLCVIDAQHDEGPAWESWAKQQGLRLRCFATAAEALRFNRSHDVRQWVINASLPGISGIELCQMLKRDRRPAAVYVTTDCYSAAEERAARIAGASMYLCKPLDRESLLPRLSPRSAK